RPTTSWALSAARLDDPRDADAHRSAARLPPLRAGRGRWERVPQLQARLVARAGLTARAPGLAPDATPGAPAGPRALPVLRGSGRGRSPGPPRGVGRHGRALDPRLGLRTMPRPPHR